MKTKSVDKTLVYQAQLPKIPYGSHPVRFLRNQEQTWWVAADVVTACGYKRTTASILVRKHTSLHNRKYVQLEYKSHSPRTSLLSDAGVLELTTGMSKPQASSVHMWFLRNKTIAASYPETTISAILEATKQTEGVNDAPLTVPDTVPSDPGMATLCLGDAPVTVKVDRENETFWATQKDMAQLFDVDRTVINKHIGRILETDELSEELTCAKNAQVQNEGGKQVTRTVSFYNLDMMIAVGYRVNSKKATRFRQMATEKLKELFIQQSGMRGPVEPAKPIAQEITTKTVIAYLEDLEKQNKDLQMEVATLKEIKKEAATLCGRIANFGQRLLTG